MRAAASNCGDFHIKAIHCGQFALLLSLCFSSKISANESALTDTDIERINVSFIEHNYAWLRTSAALQQRDLRGQYPSIDSASLLHGIAGLQADQRGNFAQDSRISVRGFGTRSSFGVRGVEMTLDGLPLSTPDGQVQPSTLMLGQLQQVEVLKGPFAALYGNASGGVIAFVSKPAVAGGIQLQQQHSALFDSSSLLIGNDLGEFAWAQSKHQGYRAHNSAQKRQAYWRKAFELSTELSLNLRYDWSNDPLLEDPLALTEAEWRQDPTQTANVATLFDTKKSSAQQGLSARLNFDADEYNWQLSSWQQQRQIQQYLAFTGDAQTSAGGIVDLTRRLRGLKGQWQHSIDWGFWQIIASAEHSTDQRLGFVNQFGSQGALRRDETGDVSAQDLGTNVHLNANTDLDIFAGVRVSRQRFRVTDWFINQGNPDDSGAKSESHAHWALGSTYQLSKWQSLNLSVGEGFESPTLTEMAYTKNAAGLNLGLQAAKALQWQAGWKYAKAQSSFSFDLFHIDTNDELLIDQSVGGRTSYRNAASTRRYGAEFSAEWHQTEFWQHRLTATAIDARFQTSDQALINGRQLPGLAKHQFSWQLDWYPLQSPSWQLQSIVDFKSKMATDDRNQQFAPAATLWRIQSRWQGEFFAGQWQAWLAGENIGKKQYVGAVVVNQGNGRSFEPGLPRQWLAGIQYSYQLN